MTPGAVGSPAKMGSEPCEERVFITHPRPAPAPRRSRIAFSARISKAAPGLFRSRNLILLWVYFSTLENSQCRTRSRPHPACGWPPCSPGGGRVGPGDRVLPRRPSAGHSPHEWLGAEPGTQGAGGGRAHPCTLQRLPCRLALGPRWASAPPLGEQLWLEGGRRVTLRLELRLEAPKRKPRPGDREHRGPQARGPRARGTRPRPATPHCAPRCPR